MSECFLLLAIITRWSYKRGGRKAGFHCMQKYLTTFVCSCYVLMSMHTFWYEIFWSKWLLLCLFVNGSAWTSNYLSKFFEGLLWCGRRWSSFPRVSYDIKAITVFTDPRSTLCLPPAFSPPPPPQPTQKNISNALGNMQSQAHIKRIVYAKIINCGYHHGSRPDYDMIIRWHRMSKSWCLLNRVINVFLFLLIGTLDTNTLLDDVNLFGTSNIHSTCSVRNYTLLLFTSKVQIGRNPFSEFQSTRKWLIRSVFSRYPFSPSELDS